MRLGVGRGWETRKRKKIQKVLSVRVEESLLMEYAGADDFREIIHASEVDFGSIVI